MAKHLGACAFCGRAAKGEMHLVAYDLVRHTWPICDSHAACLAVQEVKVSVRCMDTLFQCSSLPFPPGEPG